MLDERIGREVQAGDQVFGIGILENNPVIAVVVFRDGKVGAAVHSHSRRMETPCDGSPTHSVNDGFCMIGSKYSQ